MEVRARQAEERWKDQSVEEEKWSEKCGRMFLLVKHLICLFIPLRRRSLQLIDTQRFLRRQASRFEQIRECFPSSSSSSSSPSPKSRFRISVIAILAQRRFLSFSRHENQFHSLEENNLPFDETILLNFTEHSFSPSSLLALLNRLTPTLLPGFVSLLSSLSFTLSFLSSLLKLIASSVPRSSIPKVSDVPLLF